MRGEPPTPEMVAEKAKEIDEEIKKYCNRLQVKSKYPPGTPLPPEVRAAQIEEELKKQNKKLEHERAARRQAESVIPEAKQDMANANIVVNQCEQEGQRISAQIQELKYRQKDLRGYLPEYNRIEQDIWQRRMKLRSVRQRQREAKFTTRWAGNRIKRSNIRITKAIKTIEELETKMRELTDEMEALRGKSVQVV